MGRFEIQQIDFEGGIAETVKQNYNQSGQLNSVLWLNNYNPNLEQHTAVMRPGIKPIVEKISRQAETDTIVRALLKSLTSQWNDDNVLISSTLLELSNPEYQNAYFLFLKWKPVNNGVDPSTDYLPADHELTSIIGEGGTEATGIFVFTYNPNDDTPNASKLWYNSFLPDLISDYPGWYPMGTMKDWQRWGETILFVTKMIYPEGITDEDKAILNKYLFPVYKWTFWNLSKKRELGPDRYFNGLDFGPNNEQLNVKKYLVESPLLSLRNNIIEAYEVYNGHQGMINGIKSQLELRKIYLLSDNTEIADTKDLKDISIFFFENDLYDNTEYFRGTSKQRYPSDFNYLCPFGEMNYFGTTEIPNGLEKITNDNEYLAEDDTLYDGIYKQVTNAISSQERVTKDGKDLLMAFYQWDTTYDPNEYFLVYTFYLPNYIDSKMPRNWLYGDKIPFIVTIVSNGQEIVINKGTKYIKSSNNWVISEDTSIDSTEKEKIKNSALALDLQLRPAGNQLAYVSPISNKTLEGDTLKSASYSSAFTMNTYVHLRFCIRITEGGKKYLINNNVQSIRLYVSSPHETKSHLRSIGTTFYAKPTRPLYSYPAIERIDENDLDYSKFGLVKEFIIDGKGDYIDSYYEYRGENHRTNSWEKKDASIQPGLPLYFTVPQEDGDDYPESRSITIYDNPIESFAASLGNADFTPDFILWDYPTDRPTLQLGGSGKYWQGLGTGLIMVIKGRSIIGQCIDKDDNEEQAIIRYCAMQGPVMLYGIFYDEHRMYIGHNRHVAFMEFREQALYFTRKDHYRQTLNDISDETTWEINEHYQGHGTFNQKTIITTPYGYIYCNENGIWISDGAIPKSLTENSEMNINVTSLYRMVAIGDSYAYISLFNPGTVTIYSNLGYNTNMELSFDTNNNELILSSPVVDNSINYELRLIFSFSKKNWRAEKYNLSYTDTEGTATIKTSTELHKIKFNIPKLVHTNIIGATDISEDKELNFSQQDINLEHDEANWNDRSVNVQASIQGEIYTHEAGDGILNAKIEGDNFSWFHLLIIRLQSTEPFCSPAADFFPTANFANE